MKKCIVVFTAHTADAELGAGGTIAKFVRQGYRAIVVIVTTSVSELVIGPLVNKTSDSLTPCELAELREQEAYASAQIIGHELEFLHINERFLIYQGKRYYVDFRVEPPLVKLPGTGCFGSVSPDASAFSKKVQEILLREEPEFILTRSRTPAMSII